MRRFTIFSGLLVITGVLLYAAATAGSGAATPAIQQSFINAYTRGQFSIVANPVPLNNVHAFGTPGLVQEFSLKSDSNTKLALVKPDPNAPVAFNDTLQVYSDLYAFYTAVTVNTAGYPVNDTTACPTNNFGVCNYELFTKNYALFVYSTPFAANYAVRDPFYTPWASAGGTGGAFGPVTSSETAVTSYSKVQGIQQTFVGGAIFSYPAGATTPAVHTLVEPMNSAYNGAGGYAALGFPTAEAVTDNVSRVQRQSFENGRIEVAADGTPTVFFPIRQIDVLYGSQNVVLALNSTITVTASVLDTRGVGIMGRVLTWSSSNGSVLSIAANGDSATIKAIGAGSANVIVTGEGKTSPPLTVVVPGVCCSLGDGAPLAVAQAFQASITRNHISGGLTVGAPAVRSGKGYTQAFSASDGTAYVVAQADISQVAWVMTGPIYPVYVANGGFSGALGYPASDVAGGVQRFATGAFIAGATPHVIPVLIATKWLQTAPGDPLGDAAAFQSFAGKTGLAQSFAGGTIFAVNAGNSFLSNGPILARYMTLSGPAGALGLPTGDIFVNGSAMQQNFETGYIDLQPGAGAAVEHFNPRHPAITVSPATVTPGGRVHIAATGFAPGAVINVSITGQTGFQVQPAAGAYEWDVLVPAAAKSATVSVQAKAAAGADSAASAYTIMTPRELLAGISLVSGDQQSGFPGSALRAPLVALVTDASGNPLQGVPVAWSASPGAVVQGAGATDANGLISLRVRLPQRSGVVAGSLTAGGQVVAFSALAAAGIVPGARPVPANASANPWLAAAAAGAWLRPESSDDDHVRDLLNAGSPVLLVSSAGVAVANGVDANGAITLLNGAAGPAAVAAFSQAPSQRNGAFTVASEVSAQAVVSSAAGACLYVDVQATRYHFCDGTQSPYELDFGNPMGATVTNISTGAVQTIAANTGLSFVLGAAVAPQPLTITSVVDSAAFDRRISPGGLFTIFGTGLATGTPTVVAGGKPAKVLAAFPFQINAQLASDATTGNVQVTNLLGSVLQPLTVLPTSPGVFVVGSGLGAILNQDASLNSPDNPGLRGQYISIYCTGLGTAAGTEVLLNGSVLQPSYAGVVAGFIGLYQVNVQVPGAFAPSLNGMLQLRVGGVLSNTVPVAVQ